MEPLTVRFGRFLERHGLSVIRRPDHVREHIEEREHLVAETIAQKIEQDAETKIRRGVEAGNGRLAVEGAEEHRRARRIRRGEEDWAEEVAGAAFDEMFNVWGHDARR